MPTSSPPADQRVQRFADRMRNLAASPLFAYATIALLQLSRMRDIGRFRDMTAGDDCTYFVNAWRWFAQGRLDIAWSPLYTIFYGSLMHVTSEPAAVMFLHRVAIAVAATVLVLAVMRRLLPAPAAWIVAAWWAVMPVNFDTMYEVHLFAVLPILIAWLIVLRRDSPIHRGAALGVLLLDGLLLRNETLLAALLFGVFCLIRELRPGLRPRVATLASAYGIPMILVGAALAFCYERSWIRFPALGPYLEAKHTVNMGQVYAFGWQQRHPQWRKSPWLDYGELCLRDFGAAEPTFGTMLRRNPAATLRHVEWNVTLIPAGVQLMLFSGTSGRRDPDYAGKNLGRVSAAILTVLTILIVLGGVRAMRRDRARWRDWFASRTTAWMLVICVAIPAVLVMLIERPRPAYLFGLTVPLMALIGACGVALWNDLPRRRDVSALLPPFMLGLAVLVPSAYTSRHRPGPHSLLAECRRLKPFEAELARSDTVYVGPRAPATGCYIGHGLPACFNDSIFNELPPGMTVTEFLRERHVNLLEIDAPTRAELGTRRPGIGRNLSAELAAVGWHRIGRATLPDGPWELWRFDRTDNSRTANSTGPAAVISTHGAVTS